MAKWQKYFTIVQSTPSTKTIQDSQDVSGGTLYNSHSWYQRLVQGSSTRMTRYREFDGMDNDVDVARALDTIAEEMTQINRKTNSHLDLIFDEIDGTVPSTTSTTLSSAIRYWSRTHKFDKSLFHIARAMVKYGDCFFRKSNGPTKTWEYVHPKNVIAAVVDENDIGKIIAWQIRKDTKQAQANLGGIGVAGQQYESEFVTEGEIIRFSLNDDMSETAPFGESILKPVYRSFKQKELLEDAIIIYRISRAPERRVFYIDTGKMPPQRTKQYLEQIKNEIKQKKIPTQNGAGEGQVESIYNPHSTQEDFFFAQRADGKGSRVETLPGGCLSMDTKVPLLDGRTLSLTEITDEYNDGEELWAYSCDPKTGEFAPGLISWAGVTHEEAEVLEVELDNGEIITCTLDHQFPIWGRGKIQAQHLEVNDSVIAANFKEASVGTLRNKSGNKYTQIFDQNTKQWEFVHRKVATYMNKTHNQVVHHVNFNRYDNDPSNLRYMGRHDHMLLHSEFAKLYQPIATATSSFKYHNDNEYRAIVNKRLLKLSKEHHCKLFHNNEYRNMYTERVSEGVATYIKDLDPVARTVRNNQSIANLETAASSKLAMFKNDAECHNKVCNNITVQYPEDMLVIIKHFFDNGLVETQQLLEALNASPVFMDIFQSANVKTNAVTKIQTDTFRPHQLTQLLEFYELGSWKAFKRDRMCAAMNVDDISNSAMSTELVALMKSLVDLTATGLPVSELSKLSNSDIRVEVFLREFNELSTTNRTVTSIHPETLNKAAVILGYNNYPDFKSKATLFNHRVVAIRKIAGTRPVGTITVDKNEVHHAHHTFALSAGVYNFNSGLGELSDLEYFQARVYRGLRIPTSYMSTAGGESSPIFNDGRIGQAYIEELRFAEFCMRLQRNMEEVLDEEFKIYLRELNINTDPGIFRLKLPEPTNFGLYKQQEADSAILSTLAQSDGVPFLSKRFALSRFGQLEEEEILRNEKLKCQEMGLDSDDPERFKTIYGNPAEDNFGGLGDLGGGDLSGEMSADELSGGLDAGSDEIPV